MSKFPEKKIYQIVILLLLFSVGFIFAYDFNIDSMSHISDVALEDASYIRFVYIGSSTCYYCNNDETHKMIIDLKDLLRSFANERNYRFLSTGISVDKFTHHGLEFLNKSGAYDEIVTGASWLNLGANYYIWDRFPAYPDTPQILIILTNFKIKSAGRSIGNIEQKDFLIQRISGMNNIKEFLLTLQAQSLNEFENDLMELL